MTELTFLESPITYRWMVHANSQLRIVPRRISKEQVISAVCKYFNISFYQMTRKTRKREILYPRQVCMYFLRDKTTLALKKIGEIMQPQTRLGKPMDHSTVLHAFNTIRDLSENPHDTVKDDIENIGKLLATDDIIYSPFKIAK